MADTEAMMTDNTEPVRLRGWAAVAASAAVAFAMTVLSGADWQTALAVAVTTAAPMVAGIEWQRSSAWSPVSVQQVTTASAQVARERPADGAVPDPDVLLERVRAGDVVDPGPYPTN